MGPNAAKPKLVLRHCEAYEAEKIRRIVREGLEELGLCPFGRTLIKPNVFEQAFTRPEFVEGVALGLRDRATAVQGPPVVEIAVGARSETFERAKYYPMFERVDLDHYCFEEEPLVEIALEHDGRRCDSGFAPAPVAKADFIVHCPKLESMNRVGVELQYVQPRFIAMDGISTMNLIIMGNDQPTLHVVGCGIVTIDPASVARAQIEISGDVTLEEARHRACLSAGASAARIGSCAALPH